MAIPTEVGVERFFETSTWLDRVAIPIQDAVRNLFTRQGNFGLKARNFLNGVWLGHPLHAAITDLPVGAWTSAMIFDYLGLITGDRRLNRSADLAVGIGLVGAIAAGLAGLADYSEIEGESRRVGAVHGILNLLGIVGFALSMLRRMSRDRSGAIPLATLGYLATFVASDLGGMLVYHLGTEVSREAFITGPEQFVPVLPSDQLREGELRQVNANGTSVLLTRVDNQIYAIDNTCTHWGCSLSEGELIDKSVKCHCHGSQFALDNGSVINGPATSPVATFDVRERNGQIEVRKR
ncbi:MAG TPA: Rieske 2Fe-2S domain-containing protein [Chloroflexota bacterium]|nr:Rieske 2Fe-2S domain-containing protein [Chloroflexota bacterium]